MFENLKGLAGMLGQAKQLREKFDQLQEQLGQQVVEGEAGAGAVRVRANGRLEIVGVELDPVMITTLAGEGAEADKVLIQDLVAGAANAALAKARELVRAEMLKLTGGVDLPGMDKMLGG